MTFDQQWLLWETIEAVCKRRKRKVTKGTSEYEYWDSAYAYCAKQFEKLVIDWD